MLEALKGMFVKFSVPQEIVDHLPDVDPKALQPVFDAVEKSPQLTRTLKRRNLWVHGLVSMMDFVKIAPQCSFSDRADEIRCPTLVTWAENDPAAGFAESL